MVAILSGLLFVVIAGVGVRLRGFEFFALFGKFLDALATEGDGNKKAGRGAKVPRPPTYWTNKLVEAIGGTCEIQRCTEVTHLQVHHIKDHAAGGSNSLTNLIVLCPNHHKDCERGAINRTRQKAIIGRPNRLKDSDFPARWKASVLEKEKQAQQEDDLLGW